MTLTDEERWLESQQLPRCHDCGALADDEPESCDECDPTVPCCGERGSACDCLPCVGCGLPGQWSSVPELNICDRCHDADARGVVLVAEVRGEAA